MKKLYTYKTRIFLRDTDATGVLFSAEQIRMATETFEMFLINQGKSLKDLIASPYLMPIVHIEADYLVPLFAGDPITITFHLEKIGTKSLTFFHQFSHTESNLAVGSVRVVHVTVDKKTRASVEIPPEIKALF